MGVIRQLIDRKTLSVLDLLIKNKGKYTHLSDISNHSKIPVASTFRIINRLVSLGIVDVMLIGKMKIYRIADNEKTKELRTILKKDE